VGIPGNPETISDHELATATRAILDGIVALLRREGPIVAGRFRTRVLRSSVSPSEPVESASSAAAWSASELS
jgi:hypothetical protein